MPEIDLIPEDYRHQLRLRGWVARLGLAGGTLLLALALAKAALAWGLRVETQELERARAAQALAIDQQGKLDALRARKQDLLRRLDVLAGLRGGVAARDMLRAVDRALDGRVWLLDWTFRRAGELVEERSETARAGYFIVVPESGDEKQRAWMMQTHMEMRAQAFDHSALAAFVRRLVEQPEIEDVRILRTEVRRYTEAQVVHFELAVAVRSQA